jgi:hypothetical protein
VASQREWLRRLASRAAGDLLAQTQDELVNDHMGTADYEELSEAERDRIAAAVDELVGRLYRISALRD